MARGKRSLVETMHKEHPEFTSIVDSMSAKELDTELARYAKYADENYEARKVDEELKRTKELAKELGAPYRDAAKAIGLKSKYLIELLKSRGNS